MSAEKHVKLNTVSGSTPPFPFYEQLKGRADLYHVIFECHLGEPTRYVCRSVCKGWRDAINPVSMVARDTFMWWACLRGYIALVQWEYERNTALDRLCVDGAIKSGNLDLVKWLLNRGCEICPASACEHAARAGHLHILKWAHKLGGTLHGAFGCAKLDIPLLEWLHKHEAPWHVSPTGVYSRACQEGRVDVLDWANDKGYPWPNGHRPSCIGPASTSDAIAVVEWTHARNLRLMGRDLNRALENGQFDLVRALRKIGMQWTGESSDSLAVSGNLKLIKWAVEDGCPLGSPAAYLHACLTDAPDVAQFLKEVGVPIPNWKLNPSGYAPKMQSWMRENGLLED